MIGPRKNISEGVFRGIIYSPSSTGLIETGPTPAMSLLTPPFHVVHSIAIRLRRLKIVGIRSKHKEVRALNKDNSNHCIRYLEMQIEEYLKRQVAENTHPSSWNVVIFLTAIENFPPGGRFLSRGIPRRRKASTMRKQT